MNAATPRVEVVTLGRFAVRKDGAPLAFPTKAQRKPLALLKLLIALGGREVAEQSLSDALWPESEGDAAHRTFASTLHRLRELIGHESLSLRDRRLSLAPEVCQADALQFSAHAQSAREAIRADDIETVWREGEAASALYRGPFLDGEYEPVEILTARSRLHSLFNGTAGECAAFLSNHDQGERAVRLYRRGLEVDPSAEELCVGLMRELSRQGRNSEALAAFAAFRDALRGLGEAEPSKETQELATRLREQAGSPANPVTTGGGIHRSAAPPAESNSRVLDRPPSAMPALRRSRWPWLVAVAIVVVGAVAFAAIRAWGPWHREWDGSGPGRFEPPSIAVLPFANIGGDPEQDYFADGLTDDIITDLSSLRGLLVIARESVFRYKGQPVDVRKVGQELNVRYVLEGSVRRANGRVRISAQLIDAANATHIWAERYDEPMTSIFGVQDEITSRIVKELEISLVEGEQNRLLRVSTTNPEAYDLALKARNHFLTMSKESNNLAREEFEQVLKIEPNYAGAMLFLAWTHFQDAVWGWNDSRAPEDSIRMAESLADRLLELEPESGDVYSLLGAMRVLRHDFDKGVELGEKGVALHPNSAKTNGLLAWYLCSSDRYEDGLARMRYALRLNPLPPAWMPSTGAQCALSAHRYEEAVQLARRSRQQAPDFIEPLVFEMAALVALDRMDESRAAAREILRIDPAFDLESFIQNAFPSKVPETPARWLEAGRKAGLK